MMEEKVPEDLQQNIYSCGVCDFKFMSDFQTVLHHTFDSQHNFSCLTCEEILTTDRDFFSHMEEHLLYIPRFCKLCKAQIQPEDTFTECEYILVTCTKCKNGVDVRQDFSAFTSSRGTNTSLNNQSQSKTIDWWDSKTYDELFPRTSCFRELPRNKELHVSCPDLLEYMSKEKGQSTFNDEKNSKHSVSDSHLEPSTYKCSTCGKIFREKHLFDCHIHADYKCNICGEYFKSKSRLKNHKKTHTEKNPYRCQICDKTFRLQTNFERHLKTNHGEKAT